MSDPYQILGVSRSATASELKSAYRKLAKKLHPDVNPGRKDIEQKFKEVTSAYDLLSNEAKRARFDRGEIDAQGQERGFGGGYGGGFSGGRSRSSAGGFGGQAGGGSPFGGFAGMEDIFAEFMGGGAQGRGARPGAAGMRGSDISYTISIPFIDACLGGKKRVTLNDKMIDISIPAGTEDGHKLRLKGQGVASPQGNAGDALIEIKVEPHAFFSRKADDILLEMPISLPEAVSGGSVTVPTLSGSVAVKVPKGSNTGTTLRLKGKGVPLSQSVTGDMLVKLKIMLPDPVPQDLTDLIEKWAKKNAYDPRKKLGY